MSDSSLSSIYRTVLDRSREGVIVIRKNGEAMKVLYANAAAHKYCGLQEGSVSLLFFPIDAFF